MTNRRISLIFLVGFIAASSTRVLETSGSNSSEESVEIPKFESRLASNCLRKTGSNATYETLVTNSASSQLCIMSNFDADLFPADLNNLREATRIEFFTKYCPQFRKVLNCIEPVTSELRKCLDHDEVKLLDVIVNILPEALNLTCKDNGRIFFMNDASVDECGPKFSGFVQSCAYKIWNTTAAIDLSNYGPKQCDDLGLIRECLEQQLIEECKSSRLMEIFDVFYRPMAKAGPCKDVTMPNQ